MLYLPSASSFTSTQFLFFNLDDWLFCCQEDLQLFDTPFCLYVFMIILIWAHQKLAAVFQVIYLEILLTIVCSQICGHNQICPLYITTQQTFALMKRWKRWRSLEDVFRLRLQKTSWSRPIYSSWSYVFKTSSRRFQDVFKTPSRRLAKTSSRRLAKTSSRHLQDVLLRHLFKTSSRRLAKTSSRNRF